MRLNEYQAKAARTIRNSADDTPRDRIAHFTIGLSGETGELAEMVKKHLYHGLPLDVAAVEKELGDVLWYVAALATTLGLDLDGVAHTNVRKLEARYPNGFVRGGGQR